MAKASDMSPVRTEFETLPPGTPEDDAKARQMALVQSGCLSCDLSGDEDHGWTLASVWPVVF